MKKNISLFFPNQCDSSDMRMSTDRLLCPSGAHPLVRDFLDSIKESRIGDAQLALSLIEWHLDVDKTDVASHLGFLAFANASYSQDPMEMFEYLIDAQFSPDLWSTKIIEHLVLSRFHANKHQIEDILCWFIDHGGLVKPESVAPWKAMARAFPDVFQKNHSKLESIKLDSYIRSQPLEVREVTRL